MNDSAKGTELSKAQAQIKQLEGTVATYKLRLKEISDLVPKADLEKLLMRLGIRDICELSQESNTNNVTDNNNVVNANKKKGKNWMSPGKYIPKLIFHHFASQQKTLTTQISLLKLQIHTSQIWLQKISRLKSMILWVP